MVNGRNTTRGKPLTGRLIEMGGGGEQSQAIKCQGRKNPTWTSTIPQEKSVGARRRGEYAKDSEDNKKSGY